jgi:hypothetical protein
LTQFVIEKLYLLHNFTYWEKIFIQLIIFRTDCKLKQDTTTYEKRSMKANFQPHHDMMAELLCVETKSQ